MNQKYHNLKSRRGFSIIEAIIAASLLFIALALALPALQSMREAARNTVCQDRLAAIGKDTYTYHDLKCRLPVHIGSTGGVEWADWISAGSGEYWGNQQSTSPLALLANLDTNFRIAPIMFDDQVRLQPNTSFFNVPGYYAVASQQLERFRCPSDSSIDDAIPTMSYTLSVVGIDFGQGGSGGDFLGALYTPRD